MKKIINHLGYNIEVFYDNMLSGFAIYYEDTLVTTSIDYPGFQIESNGLLEEAKWSIESHIARTRMRKLKNVHKAFANV